TDQVPKEIEGVSRYALLTQMGEVLIQYGSHPLRQAIEQYGDGLILMLSREGCNCVQDCVAYLKERELL
ncbi:MAG: hypothetical protein AAGB19_08525, partial [Cyanobacteria bacterium P01_F01_bin.3]